MAASPLWRMWWSTTTSSSTSTSPRSRRATWWSTSSRSDLSRGLAADPPVIPPRPFEVPMAAPIADGQFLNLVVVGGDFCDEGPGREQVRPRRPPHPAPLGFPSSARNEKEEGQQRDRLGSHGGPELPEWSVVVPISREFVIAPQAPCADRRQCMEHPGCGNTGAQQPPWPLCGVHGHRHRRFYRRWRPALRSRRAIPPAPPS